MNQDQLDNVKQQLSQIAEMLMLNGTLTECPGLIHGKMGIAIFFFHYAKYTENMLFADYALDMLIEMQSQIHVNSPADYETGIAGIGVGMDYLIRKGLLIEEEEDICEDFDQRMYRAVMSDPWQDFSLYDGVTGYGRYWISRLRYHIPPKQARECLSHILQIIEENFEEISREEQGDVYCFLCDMQKTACFDRSTTLLEWCKKWDLSSLTKGECLPRLGSSVVEDIICAYQYNNYWRHARQDDVCADLNFVPLMEKAPVNMGLLTGSAGEGLLRLSILERTDDSWMFLF